MSAPPIAAVGLVPHRDRPDAHALAVRGSRWLAERGIEVRIPADDAVAAGLPELAVDPDAFAQGLDVAISLGGDGTMLRTVDLVYECGAAVLGVNVGQMGYLTEVEPVDLEDALARLLSGDFEIDERMVLEVVVGSTGSAAGRWWALNETVIEKSRTGRLARLEVAINGAFFTTYAADGVIVATPTGSTAYSFSARGPIVSPRHRCLLLTPVSPHMLFDRSLVLDADEELRFTVVDDRNVVVTLDGRELGDLESGDTVTCTGGPKPARVVTFGPRDFHQILKAKFGLADREMLRELRVADLGIVEELTLLLEPGSTAITGETGAGKTLLVEAVELLLGRRADTALVRRGASEARVEGRFESADGTETVLARVLPTDGRTRAYVDGRLATAAELAEVGGRFVDLHGQNTHQSLLAPAVQRRALDRFAGETALATLATLRAEREAAARAEAELAALGGDERARARELDLLRFQIDEIESAAIDDPGEEVTLEAEEALLADAAAHREALTSAFRALEGPALDAVGAAVHDLGDRAPFLELAGRLRAVQAELSELERELRLAGDVISEDPARLESVRARRHQLRGLCRKYGDTLSEVLTYREETRRRLDELESYESRAAALEAERDAATARAQVVATELSDIRRRAARPLSAAVSAHFEELAMPAATLEVQIVPGPLTDDGADEVTFLLAPNPGEPPLPLNKAASGGELARAMLALRLVLSEAPPTLVFDEVDAGIGGEAGVAVGRLLADLGVRHQVLCVTHLAQVAAFADAQIVVSKQEHSGRTVAGAARVVDGERVLELSRMLAGVGTSEHAQHHAAELLERAAERGTQVAS